jgi:hypothetical protein
MGAGVALSSGCPQPLQNLLPGLFSLPQDGHVRTVKDAPQWMQKRLSGSISFPQMGQLRVFNDAPQNSQNPASGSFVFPHWLHCIRCLSTLR